MIARSYFKLFLAFSTVSILLYSEAAFSQAVSINSTGAAPDAQSILDVSSTSAGILLPRMTSAQRTGISTANSADHGLMVYDIDTDSYWYWDGASSGSWKEIPNTDGIASSLDDAYDNGGAGAGRVITGDEGPVVVSGTQSGNGTGVALEIDGGIQVAEDEWIGIGSTVERIEFDGSLNRVDIENADLTMNDGKWIGIDGSSPRIEFEDASGRLNMQNADIEIDNGAWIGINASNPRIEFDDTNDELNILDADLGVGTTAPDNQSLADFRSTSKGILFPRMTTAERDAIGQGTNTDYGLWIYNEDSDLYNFWDGNSWEVVPSESSITGNTLDEAYDEGGAGLGRTITASDGAVNIAGADGLTVNGNVGIGTLTPYTKLRVDAQSNGLNIPLVVRNSAANTVGDVVGIGLVNESVDYGNFYKAAMVTERTAGFGVGKLHFLVDDVSDANSATLAESRMTILPNGNVGVGVTAPSVKFQVAGDATISGKFNSNGIQESSDVRFKKNITSLSDALSNVMKLEGVSYNWRQEEFPDRNFGNRTEIGVIAQEIEKIYPELVNTDKDGYKSVQYSHIVPVLIEAIKEQQQLIVDLESTVSVTTDQLNRLESNLNLLTERLNLVENETSGIGLNK